MLARADHPLSRRQGGPRGEGRAVRRPGRRRRSGRDGGTLRRRRRRRARASSTSPRRTRSGRSSSTSWRARPSAVHAAHGRRRRAHRRRRARAPQRRRRQGVDQHRGGRRIPTSCARRRERFGAQCVVVAIDARRRARAIRAAAGRCSRTAAASRPASTRSSGRRAWRRPARARSCSPAWIATAPEGYDLELTRAVADAVDVPVIASGGVGHARAHVRRPGRGGRDAALAASIFHYGEHTVGEAKAYLTSRGVCIRAGRDAA